MGKVEDLGEYSAKKAEEERKQAEQDSAWERIKEQDSRIAPDDDGN